MADPAAPHPLPPPPRNTLQELRAWIQTLLPTLLSLGLIQIAADRTWTLPRWVLLLAGGIAGTLGWAAILRDRRLRKENAALRAQLEPWALVERAKKENIPICKRCVPPRQCYQADYGKWCCTHCGMAYRPLAVPEG